MSETKIKNKTNFQFSKHELCIYISCSNILVDSFPYKYHVYDQFMFS